jgi:hypothetical protein
MAPATSARRTPSSTGTSGAFSQLRLPLLRVEGRNGLLLANSPVADGLRRSVTKRLPCGAPERIADRLGKRIALVYDQHAGETTYSLDAFVAGLLELRREEVRYILNKVARLFGAWVIPDAQADDDISAVGS